MRLRGRRSAGGCFDGCGLRGEHRFARGRDGAGIELCRRHTAADIGSGSRTPVHCRLNLLAVPDGRQSSCAATNSIGLCLSKSLHWVCRNQTGKQSLGGKEACEPLSSRFARVRVRPAHRDYNLTAPRPEEWLLIEWPEEEAEPAKSWLSTLPEDIDFTSLVDITKLRWRIERDYLDLKQEIGLATMRAGDGAASTTMPRCASLLMPF